MTSLVYVLGAEMLHLALITWLVVSGCFPMTHGTTNKNTTDAQSKQSNTHDVLKPKPLDEGETGWMGRTFVAKMKVIF